MGVLTGSLPIMWWFFFLYVYLYYFVISVSKLEHITSWTVLQMSSHFVIAIYGVYDNSMKIGLKGMYPGTLETKNDKNKMLIWRQRKLQSHASQPHKHGSYHLREVFKSINMQFMTVSRQLERYWQGDEAFERLPICYSRKFYRLSVHFRRVW